MKVIQLFKNEKQLIKKAATQHRDAQQQLYTQYAPKMLGVCRRYIKDLQFAEDVMLKGFMKVFSNLDRFKFEGSFEGWIRRIMVNEAITFLRSQKKIMYTEELITYEKQSVDSVHAGLDAEYIQELIDRLPEGYKMVFVLFAIEGYKHQEIANMLDISESTSKSQLFKARKMLQSALKKSRTKIQKSWSG